MVISSIHGRRLTLVGTTLSVWLLLATVAACAEIPAAPVEVVDAGSAMTPTEPPPFPYEIARIDCPVQEKEVTWVGGAVLDANGEPVMEGIVESVANGTVVDLDEVRARE